MSTAPQTSSVETAEAAWLHALTTGSPAAVEALLHPDFTVVHGPTGSVQDRAQFLADLAGRPGAVHVEQLSSQVRQYGDTVVLSGIQQSAVPYQPGVPPFAIQAAVTRVWVRTGGTWSLAHLQMARRFPPA